MHIGEHYEPTFLTVFSCVRKGISVKKLLEDNKLFCQNFANLKKQHDISLYYFMIFHYVK